MNSDFNMLYPRKRPSSLVCDYVLNTTGRIPLKPNSILSNLPSRHYSNAVMSSLSWVPHHWLRREDITVIVAQRHSGWPIGRMFGAGYYPVSLPGRIHLDQHGHEPGGTTYMTFQFFPLRNDLR